MFPAHFETKGAPLSEKDASQPPQPKKGLFSRNKAPEPEEDKSLDGLMSEIESDLREDELKRIWNSYGSAFITIAVLFLVAVAGFEGWRAYETRQHAKVAADYDAAMALAAETKYDDAKAKFAEVITSGDQPYASLARLTAAGVRLEQNDVDGALALYTALAADPAADPMFRDMAVVLRAMHALDREDPKKLEAELAPLLESSTFRHTATELTALAAAKQGDTARAAQLAQGLADDETAPQSMRGRAGELAALYKAGIVPKDLPPPPANAGKAPSVTDLVAPAAESEPAAAQSGAKPAAKP
jgi:hypothetical protein